VVPKYISPNFGTFEIINLAASDWARGRGKMAPGRARSK